MPETAFQVHELTADASDLLRLHQCWPERYPCLLQSAARHEQTGRYDLLFGALEQTLSCRSDAAGFLAGLDQVWQEQRIGLTGPAAEAVQQLPFRGGWLLFLSYELAQGIEPVLTLPQSVTDAPLAWAGRVRSALILDRLQQRCFLFHEPGVAPSCIAQWHADLHDTRQPDRAGFDARLQEAHPQAYLDAVAAIHHRLRDGEVFQVNLSRLWQGQRLTWPQRNRLYRALLQHNPAPFAASACLPGLHILSSSPERLFSLRSGHLETRPIAGTRPRSQNKAKDQHLAAELQRHAKERAEHVMLIDLMRNDLGRVCRPGSIRADQRCLLESYAHVHHLVSSVTGDLDTGVTPGQVISALFPGGTITGCPKVQCMHIIAELEQQARGAYTGSLGYLNHDGDMDLNILIRSFQQDSNAMSFRTGAGIVMDSRPEAELAETRAKAQGLLRAIQAARDV